MKKITGRQALHWVLMNLNEDFGTKADEKGLKTIQTLIRAK